jgi:putative ABC transport system substrate-binding protein
MRRREFITLVAGAAAWPLPARAQERERIRRIGALMSFTADDAAGHSRVVAFAQALAEAGWIEGRNLRMEIRWSAGDPERTRKYAAELVQLAPDAILAVGSSTTGPLLEATRSVPVVFVQVAEPVGAGFVETLSHPGGNATGFMLYEYRIGAKWLQVLKEIAPNIKRAGFLQNLGVATGPGEFGAMQAAGPSLGIELRPMNVRNVADIERAIAAFAAQQPNGGLVVVGGAPVSVHRDVVIRLALQHRLPAVYSDPAFAAEGGLIAFGPDRLDQYRRAAGYVDRILKGDSQASA